MLRVIKRGEVKVEENGEGLTVGKGGRARGVKKWEGVRLED